MSVKTLTKTKISTRTALLVALGVVIIGSAAFGFYQRYRRSWKVMNIGSIKINETKSYNLYDIFGYKIGYKGKDSYQIIQIVNFMLPWRDKERVINLTKTQNIDVFCGINKKYSERGDSIRGGKRGGEVKLVLSNPYKKNFCAVDADERRIYIIGQKPGRFNFRLLLRNTNDSKDIKRVYFRGRVSSLVSSPSPYYIPPYTSPYTFPYTPSCDFDKNRRSDKNDLIAITKCNNGDFDFNHNKKCDTGDVKILDAVIRKYDLNGDGRVDRLDKNVEYSCINKAMDLNKNNVSCDIGDVVITKKYVR